MTDSLKKIAKADRSTVLCGMSGGVDSSVAAALLLKDNYSVAGATMRLYDGEFNGGAGSKSPSDDIKDAQNVCERLGIKHYILDFKEQFEKMVIDRFYSKYAAGLTPNPCVDCNRYIKFGEMLNRGLAEGIQDTEALSIRAAEQMGKAVTDAVSGIRGDITVGAQLSDNLRPVYDAVTMQTPTTEAVAYNAAAGMVNGMQAAIQNTTAPVKLEIPIVIDGMEFSRAIIPDLREVMRANPEVDIRI